MAKEKRNIQTEAAGENAAVEETVVVEEEAVGTTEVEEPVAEEKVNEVSSEDYETQKADSSKEVQTKVSDRNKPEKLQMDNELLQKRAERRKRRRRNQMMAYLTLCVFVLIVVAAVAGAVYIISNLEKQKAASNASIEQNIEDVIGSEETLIKPDETDMIPELTPEEKLDEIIDAAIEVMPLEDKVAGIFIVNPEAITSVNTAVKAGEGTKDALNEWAVGGMIYFEKNMQSAEQFAEMVNNTVLYSRYPLFICVDEEGGEVSRVAEAGLATNVGTPQSIGATADSNQAYAAGAAMSGYLKPLGVNVNFAPVADLHNIEGGVMEERAYGTDAASVSPMVVSMVQGLQENDISACLKHFPGIGSSKDDTHIGMAISDRTAEQFRAEEFAVFKAGIEAGADFVMVSHLAAPALTGDNTPCCMSEAVVTGILREELGFDGVIITDAMNMGAITNYDYGADGAAILALKAGCDMILMPDDFETAYNGVLEAVQNGTISEERINDSLRRIYRIKYAAKLEN